MHQLSVTLEDLYNGATRYLALQICEGQVSKDRAAEYCPSCRDTEMQIRGHQIGQQIQSFYMEHLAMGNRSVLKVDKKASMEGR